MTIKPIGTPQPKRVPPDADKKEPHGSSDGPGHGHRSGVLDGQANAKRRSEAYDDHSRQRRSPQKSTCYSNNRPSRSRRDAIDTHHMKRNDREILASVSNNCNSAASPNVHAMTPATATSVSSTTSASQLADTNSTKSVNSSSNSKLSNDEENGSEAIAVSSNAEDLCSGYNSGDEHYQSKRKVVSVIEWQQRDIEFKQMMLQRGFELRNVEEDGACLFRAISLQVYGDEEMHDVIRQHTMDYIYKNREYFCNFVTEDINDYIERKRRKDSHGNHIEIQAISEIYSRPIEVYSYGDTPINIFNSEGLRNRYTPIRLSYQRGSHYNALIDPYNATVGEGLGLAGYKPDLQVNEAVQLSEQLAIEQTMFEDKLKTTDWEATNEAIEEQIARESYLQWCRDNLQKPSSRSNSISATITSAQAEASQPEASPSKYSGFGGGSMMSGNGKVSAGRSSTITSTITKATNDLSGSETTTSPSSAADSDNGSFGASCDKTTGSPSDQSSFLNSSCKKLTISSGLGVAGDGGIDSDDTDRSSTSSRSSVNSFNKRRNKKRNGTKRRIEAGVAATTTRPTELNIFNLSASEAKLSKHDLIFGIVGDKGATTASAAGDNDQIVKNLNGNRVGVVTRSHTPEAEQRPCSSKHLKEITANADHKKPSSPQMNTTPEGPISNFYQELLSSTYSDDGYDQLSESEMLQRAIQMSTQDFIKDQQRKYMATELNVRK